MSSDPLDYGRLMQHALRGVVRGSGTTIVHAVDDAPHGQALNENSITGSDATSCSTCEQAL